jgi:hypothetical protein
VTGLKPEHVDVIAGIVADIKRGFENTWLCACGHENPVITEVCTGCHAESFHLAIAEYYAEGR